MTDDGPRAALRMILAIVVGYAVMRGVAIASNVMLVLFLGMPAEGRSMTPYLAAMAASSFIAAIAAGYACVRLAPPRRVLLSLGLLMLLFLSASVAVYRAAPDAQPQGYMPLITLLGVVGLWTGAMIERARHGASGKS